MIYFFLEFGNIHSFFCHNFEDSFKRSLMTYAHVVLVLVKYKFFIFFVDRVVSQMHANIFHILFIGRYVSLCGKPS